MPQYKPPTSECFIFTFKDGLLSPIAHDLKIRATDFTLDIDDALSSVSLQVNAASLRVECARRGDSDAPEMLSAKNKREIEDNITSEVLKARRYPEILFVSSAVTPVENEYRIEGQLTLHGITRSLTTTTVTTQQTRTVEVVIDQTHYGIRPYTAAFGTLRVQPNVRVRMTIPT